MPPFGEATYHLVRGEVNSPLQIQTETSPESRQNCGRGVEDEKVSACVGSEIVRNDHRLLRSCIYVAQRALSGAAWPGGCDLSHSIIGRARCDRRG